MWTRGFLFEIFEPRKYPYYVSYNFYSSSVFTDSFSFFHLVTSIYRGYFKFAFFLWTNKTHSFHSFQKCLHLYLNYQLLHLYTLTAKWYPLMALKTANILEAFHINSKKLFVLLSLRKMLLTRYLKNGLFVCTSILSASSYNDRWGLDTWNSVYGLLVF